MKAPLTAIYAAGTGGIYVIGGDGRKWHVESMDHLDALIEIGELDPDIISVPQEVADAITGPDVRP